eukprot:11813625-Alexandrium_andersonii.AAC.1
MASSIASTLACMSMWTQSALYSSAAAFMIMPNPGRSLGPNLGSARRLCLAHRILEADAATPRLE